VADKNMQFAFQGALARPQALGIRPLTYAFRPHMGRDGGVRSTGAELLAREAPRFRHALMLLDFHGCGREHESPLTCEATLDGQLQEVWDERAKSLVIFLKSTSGCGVRTTHFAKACTGRTMPLFETGFVPEVSSSTSTASRASRKKQYN